jgi:hypothetical protein
MAKNLSYLLHSCIIVLGLCITCFGQVVSWEESKRKCLIQTAESQLFVRERTNHNDGADVAKFLATCKLKPGTPWCGAFVHWVHLQCNIPHEVHFPARAANWFADRTKSIWWFGKAISKDKRLIGYHPQSGDIAGFTFWKNRITHVEIVYEWEDDDDVEEFFTIGGNTTAPRGTRNPREGVHLKKRDKDGAIISNFLSVHPKSVPLKTISYHD